jgi:Uma2 family endonuclease
MANLSYTPAPFTTRDYRELPEGGPRYQLIEGDLHMAPSPNLFHQEISANLEGLLRDHLKGKRAGKVLHAPLDVFLTDTNVYQPDILFVSTKNLGMLKVDGVHGAPDLIVEILSPSTSRLDLGAKKRVYARCGVLEFWAIDPQERKIKVYDLQKSDADPVGTWGEGEGFESRLFPGLRVEGADVFAR